MTTQDLIEQWSALWLPPERLTLSEWAERHLVLSPEYSSRSGPLRLYGWQREIFDSFTDPAVETIALMSGTQLTKTIFLQAALAYCIAADPGPALLTEPKDIDAETFSKERLAPMIRDCPLLAERVSDPKSRDSSNTIAYKAFPGGSVTLVGAITPGNLARRSIRYLFCDEIDKYPRSAGTEGDPINLARERTVTFRGRRKIILCCSPTVKGESRIEIAYRDSDQRQPWVPCHACGERQVLKWAQVKWDNSLPEQERPATAYYQCEHCRAKWDDVQRWTACNDVLWVARRPFVGTAGFWISHLYSPWKTLHQMVRDFLAAKNDRQTLKVFVNTNLAELWEEAGETPIPEILFGRREDYPHGEAAIVPKRALFLVAGVDVQDDRLEYEVCGYGRGKESWSIEYGTIRIMGNDGEPLRSSDPKLWLELDKVLARDYPHEAGGTVSIMAMAVDTGNRPKPVYDFARRHAQLAYSPAAGAWVAVPRTVIPIKGSSSETMKLIASVTGEDAARRRGGIRIVSIGTAVGKQELFDNLRCPRPTKGEAMPGYCHFPSYGLDYFEGLCSEKRVVTDEGSVRWEKQGRNEPLDIRVYHRAAAALFGVDRFNEVQWARLEKAVGIVRETPPATVAVEQTPRVAAAARQSQAVVSSSFMRNFLG